MINEPAAVPPTGRVCDNCQHLVIGDDGQMACRRYPPLCYPMMQKVQHPITGKVMDQMQTFSIFPTVQSGWTCGEFEKAVLFGLPGKQNGN